MIRRTAIVLFALTTSLYVSLHAAHPATVRVRLFSVKQPSEVRVTNPAGQTTLINVRTGTPFRSNGPVTLQLADGKPIRLQGTLEVTSQRAALVIISELRFEDYVAAVLAGESSGFRSEESLKAMAVAVRSYASHFLKRHAAEGFDFCDTTHCQDFRVTAVTERLRKAAADTRDEVVVYEDQPIAAYYHQDCGGVTESQAPYLQQLKDSFCASHGRLRWTAELTASDLKSALAMGEVSVVEVTERTPSGRAARLRISGGEGRILDAETFRLTIGRKLGWDKIRSDLYEVRRSGSRFVFEGSGSGHGIGLCQNGAAAMGEEGFGYKEILAYYYPNTRIQQARP